MGNWGKTTTPYAYKKSQWLNLWEIFEKYFGSTPPQPKKLQPPIILNFGACCQ
jgi:hypothetical protein